MSVNIETYKFPFISDKFAEGVFTKTQWLIDYCTFREHADHESFSGVTPQQFQSAMGQNCSPLANRFRGSLLGLAVGDALGVTLEFQPRPESDIVTDIVGGGPFDLKAGQWTDDTSMALCTAHSLVRRRTFDPHDQMNLFLSWWKNGSFSSTGKCFDIGVTTASALRKYMETGDPMAGNDDPRSAGNGSLMRLAPVVLFYASEPRDATRFSAEASKVTHGAVEAIDACRLFAAILLGALYGEEKDRILSPLYHPIKDYWEFHPLTESIARVSKGSYKDKTRNTIKSTGYVVESLEAALWAFYNSNSFKTGATMAVNLGGDADTVGAIYGQLAGAFYGETEIPINWIKTISYYYVFYTLADELVSFYSGKPIYK